MAYPWQKARDRELQVGTEARAAAKEFVEILQLAFFEISDGNEMSPATHAKLNQAVHSLHFYFDFEDVLLARSYLTEHIAWAKKRHEVEKMKTPDEAHIVMHGSDEAALAFIERVKARYHVPKLRKTWDTSGIETK